MLSLVEYLQGIRAYKVHEPETIVAEIAANIAQLPDEPSRKAATSALAQMRARLEHLDLRDCGWPPQVGTAEHHADLLHADTQKLVSAVLRVDHRMRRVTVLKYVLKVKR